MRLNSASRFRLIADGREVVRLTAKGLCGAFGHLRGTLDVITGLGGGVGDGEEELLTLAFEDEGHKIMIVVVVEDMLKSFGIMMKIRRTFQKYEKPRELSKSDVEQVYENNSKSIYFQGWIRSKTIWRSFNSHLRLQPNPTPPGNYLYPFHRRIAICLHSTTEYTMLNKTNFIPVLQHMTQGRISALIPSILLSIHSRSIPLSKFPHPHSMHCWTNRYGPSLSALISFLILFLHTIATVGKSRFTSRQKQQFSSRNV